MSVAFAVVLTLTGAYWGLLLMAGWFIFGLPTPRLNPETSIMLSSDLEDVKRAEALKSLEEKIKQSINQ